VPACKIRACQTLLQDMDQAIAPLGLLSQLKLWVINSAGYRTPISGYKGPALPLW
jgi:hypothetical protein